MTPFEYVRPVTVDAALQAAKDPATRFIGGGTNLIDLMKGGNENPRLLIDINHLKLDGIESLPDGGLRIGAGVRNADLANHPQIRQNYPLLSRALLAGASPQLRNMATVGGNLMQRTRCDYFVDPGFPRCNKRIPGSGCGAREGENRLHAILGASSACVAVNPSDMNVALLALNATINVRSIAGERRIKIEEFHRLPGERPERDNTLNPGELIVAIDLPQSPFSRHHYYLKVRDRASYAFALVSVAVGLQLDGERINGASIALGGVAHKPWPATDAAQMLIGKDRRTADLGAVAAAAVAGAIPLEHNAYKIILATNAVKRAVRLATEAT